MALVKRGIATAVASSDLDCVCHGAPHFVRNLGTDKPIQEISFDKVLEGFEMTHVQFIDYCILLGCDYCETISGVGPKRALDLIRQHETIENVLEAVGGSKVTNSQNYLTSVLNARTIFSGAADACTVDKASIKFTATKEKELTAFLVDEL